MEVVSRTELIGRSDELADVVGLIPDTPLVTLVGTAGVGKTRLALEIADAVRDEFPDGVSVIDLTTVESGDLDPDLFASRLGHRTFDLAVEAITGTTTLVLLDNCEHVLDELAAPLDELLRRCRDLRVLATSRAPLELGEEHVYPVRPLDIADALTLLRARGVAAGAEFPAEPTLDHRLSAVAERVDRVPLAIELAAIRLRSLDADQVVDALDANLDLLRRGPSRRSGGDQRHDSVTNAISWSYELLDDDCRAAFRRLSVLENGFGLERAHAVIGASDIAGSAELLDALVAQSLVSTTVLDGRIRYRLLQTVRQYGRDRLEEAGETGDAVERFVASVRSVADDLVRRAVERWDDAVVTDAREAAPELLAALRATLDHDETGERACALMLPGWGLVHETFAGEIARVGAEVMDRWTDDTAGWGDVAAITATASMRLSELDRAVRQADRAVAAGGLLAVPVGRRAIAMVLQHRGDFDEALAEVRAAIQAARRLGLAPFEAELHLFETSLLGQTGDLRPAIAHADEACRVNAESAPVSKWAHVLRAFLLLDEDADGARSAARAVARTVDDIRHPGQPATSAAMIARHVGAIELWHGDAAAAAPWLRTALQVSREVGERPHAWSTLRCIGLAAVQRGRRDDDDDLTRRGRSLIGVCRSASESPAPGFVERRLSDRIMGAAETDDGVGDAAAALDLGGGTPYALGFELLDEIAIDDRGPSRPATSGPAVDHEVDGRIEVGPDTSELAWRGEHAVLATTKGMTDLAVMIRRQGVEVSAAELMRSFVDESDVGEIIDADARRAYEEHLRALQADIADAEAANDLARLERLQDDFDRIAAHLASALGLGGRSRRPGGSTEKARSAVTWRLRAAIRKIDDAMPALGRHLRVSVRTGTFCSYDPERTTLWEVDDHTRVAGSIDP